MSLAPAIDQSVARKRRGGVASKLNPRRPATPKQAAQPIPMRRNIPHELRALADAIERNPDLATTIVVVRAGEDDVRGMRVLGPKASVLETHGWLWKAQMFLSGLAAGAMVGAA